MCSLMCCFWGLKLITKYIAFLVCDIVFSLNFIVIHNTIVNSANFGFYNSCLFATYNESFKQMNSRD